MSLEAVVKENTEAINRLISVLAAMPAVGVGAPVPVGTPPDSTGTPHDSHPADIQVLDYLEDVRKPFLALLNSNRPGAMKVLADLGVANLKGFEGQPETYADLVRRIKEAQNG